MERDSIEVELPIKLSGQTGPLAWLGRWAKPQAGLSLASSAIVSRDVGWAMQFPGALGIFPCWGGLEAILSYRQGHEPTSLPQQGGRTGSKAGTTHWLGI